MPWHLSHQASGYFVIKSSTGEKKNKEPMSKEKAEKYLKALYANVPEASKNNPHK